MQVFCDEAGIPVRAIPGQDALVHERVLDSKMRAFFRLTSYAHR